MTISELRIDSAVSNMAESLCLCRDSAFVLATRGGAASRGDRGDWGSRWGLSNMSSSPLKRSAAGWGCRWTARFLRCFPWWPDVDRCIGGLSLFSPGMRRPGCAAPFGCGSVVRARPRDDGYAFPGRRDVGLVWKKKSTASRSFEADEWFLMGVTLVLSAPPLVPFFPEVHEELTRSWKAPFTARNISCSLLPPSPPSTWSRFGVRGHPLGGAVLWPCNCVQQPLPPCGVTRVSPHGPVGISQV